MTSLILASVGVFLGVILLLVIILLIAKRYLSPSGKVKVTINGEKEVEVEVGSSLLSTLAENKIFLPSACGGGGSCAQCRCQVEAGGGEILPTEKVHFSRKEQQANWRLGCQVKVKQDMEIKVPEAVLGVKKWECEVVSNNNVATFIKEFVVRLPKGEHLNFVSGGYIQIDIPKYDIKYADYEIEDRFRGDWDKFKMWDLTCKNEEETMRAYSMANYPAEGDIVMLNVRIATPPFDRVNGGFMNVPPGISSSYIFSLKPGDKVMVSGPFGEFHPILDSGREMLYVGGGAVLLLECVPAQLGKEIAELFPNTPVIGIGAGNETDGQVLVVQDMLGLTFGRVARFVRNFMKEQAGETAIIDAFKSYHAAVQNQSFPAKEHTFQVEL
jgi:Na+-transporting NADH:ubiquinone oxidoreductase subunit F